MTSTEFRVRLADLLLDPQRRADVRDADDPAACFDRTRLTGREIRTLIAIAHHPTIVGSCDAAHLARFVPLAGNLPTTCAALGDHLRTVLDGFWRAHPVASPHDLDESDRFADYVAALAPAVVPCSTRSAVAAEGDAVHRELSRRVRPPGPLGDLDDAE